MSVLRVRESFAVSVGGTPRVYNPGDLVDADDPVVKGRQVYFEAPEASIARRSKVESATAEPGEQRAVAPKPVKKPAAKAAPKGGE